MTKRSLIFSVLGVMFMPLFAAAQTNPNGVLGCNAGQYGGSPGTTAAQGGVFVPVSDAGVTLNTGVLVYKECVLRGVVDRLREQMTTGVVRNGTVAFLTGRSSNAGGGNIVKSPLYPTNLNADEVSEATRVVARDMTDATLDSINPAFRQQIRRAVITGYYNATYKSDAALACPYADLQNALAGHPRSIWDALDAFQNPACTPLGAYQLASARVNSDARQAVNDMILKLNWSGGVYDVAAPDANGQMVTATPGRFVGAGEEQLLTSGFRQQENANDINQMVGSLFASMSGQIISSARGLAGLTQSNGGQPSYLDQMSTAAGIGTRDALANAALDLIDNLIETETQYGAIVVDTLNLFTRPQNTFKQLETQCFRNIIDKTCDAGTLLANGTCKHGEDTLQTTASSTKFSSLAIRGIPNWEDTAKLAANIQISKDTVNELTRLRTGLTSNPSSNLPAQAIAQLDQYLASGRLHKGTDLEGPRSIKTNVHTAIDAYIRDITRIWKGDSNDGTPGANSWNGNYPPFTDRTQVLTDTDAIGWCNFNDPTTITRWAAKWKK